MRLTQRADCPLMTSVNVRNVHGALTSPTLQFHLASKPVVELSRVLPEALGLSLLIGGVMAYAAGGNGAVLRLPGAAGAPRARCPQGRGQNCHLVKLGEKEI
jgi:hypothetical protein